MRATGLDHLDVVVSNLERSLAFYSGLLRPLGYEAQGEIVGEHGERVVYLLGRGLVEVGLREARSAGAYNRYRVGMHHIAFAAPSRQAVDERLRWARSKGVEIENDPKEYDYSPGYYAGFLRDPDGIKLEVVHRP
jgi:glyoxylase I family protein